MILQIQEIEIYVDQQEEQGEKKSAKEALMMWCQRNTRGYREVHIRVIIIIIFFFVTKMRNTSVLPPYLFTGLYVILAGRYGFQCTLTQSKSRLHELFQAAS